MVYNDFVRDVNEVMYRRMEKAETKSLKTPEYYDLSRESDEIEAQIKRALPGDLQNKINELEELRNHMAGIESEFHYRQGFSDAVKLIVKTLSL